MVSLTLAFALLHWQASSGIVPKEYLPQLPAASHTLATVNGLPLKAEDVESMTWDVMHTQIEEDYVDYLVVKSAADKAGVSISDAEMKSNLDDVLNNVKKGLHPQETVASALAKQNFTQARLYLRLKLQLLLNKLQLHELQPKDWVNVSTMIFPIIVSSPNGQNEAGVKATDAYTQLEKGTPWETVLGRVTTDQRVIANKGGIGWHSLDVFPKTVRDDLATIKVGGYTRPAKTENGIQIFRLEMRGSDATGDSRKALQKQFLDSNSPTYFKKLKDAAKIVRE